MITVFGSINMDLIATTDRLPKPGETVAGNGFATAAGGKGADRAFAADAPAAWSIWWAQSARMNSLHRRWRFSIRRASTLQASSTSMDPPVRR